MAATVLNLFGAFNWYGFLIGGGMVICIVLGYFISRKRGYYKDMVFDIAICCIPFAIVGARLYYVIFDIIDGGSWTFKEIIGLGGNGLSGLAIYGGLIGAVLGAFLLVLIKRKKPVTEKATFLQMADLAFPLIILGQAVGRWGNFANQEAYGNFISANQGDPWTWFPYAVYIPDGIQGAGYYQATFFYEFLLNIAGCALLLWLYLGKRKSFDGFVMSVYCIVYGVGRFFIESLRSDSLWLIPDVLRVSQLVSALIVIFGISFILVHLYRARTKNMRPFLFVPEQKLDYSYLGYAESILSHPVVYVKKSELKSDDGAGEDFDADLREPQGEADETEDDDDFGVVRKSAPLPVKPQAESGEGESAAQDLPQQAAAGGAEDEQR